MQVMTFAVVEVVEVAVVVDRWITREEVVGGWMKEGVEVSNIPLARRRRGIRLRRGGWAEKRKHMVRAGVGVEVRAASSAGAGSDGGDTKERHNHARAADTPFAAASLVRASEGEVGKENPTSSPPTNSNSNSNEYVHHVPHVLLHETLQAGDGV